MGQPQDPAHEENTHCTGDNPGSNAESYGSAVLFQQVELLIQRDSQADGAGVRSQLR